MTDAQVIAALTDRQVVGLTLFGEARGEPIEGKVAVANVIRNRVAAGRFGTGYRGVCLRRKQFSCWNDDGSPNHLRVMETARALIDGAPSGPLLRECFWVTEGIIADNLRDNVHGAAHYMTAALFETGTVAWAQGLRPIARINAHVFFVGGA